MTLSRREFLKYGAATAAGLAAGERPSDLAAGQSFPASSRIKDAQTFRGVCPYCAVGCAQLIFVKGGRLLDIEGDPDTPHTEGALCARGSSTYQLAVTADRLTRCRYRAPGSAQWEDKPLDWMMTQIAERIRKVRDETFVETVKIRGREVPVNRCEGIAWFGSAALDNEESYLIAKLARALGIVNLETSARLSQSATLAALEATFGRGATTTSLIDVMNADVVLATADWAECQPVGYKWVMKAKERGAKIIHVDSRFTRTSATADLWVPIRSGTHLVFFGGLIRYAIEQEKYFRDYVANYTNASFVVHRSFKTATDLNGLFAGYDPARRRYVPSSWTFQLDGAGEPRRDPALQDPHTVFQLLRRQYRRYTPEMVERVCGIPKDLFLRVAETFCSASGREKTATIAYGVELNQSTNGTQQIRALTVLQLLLGNVGRPGGGVVAVGTDANGQGATDMGTLSHTLPGYLTMPLQARHRTLAEYLDRETPARGYGVNTPKFFVSLLKAWWGGAAARENDFAYHYLPKREATDAHSYQHCLAAILKKRVKGLICTGENPAVDSPNAKMARAALRNLEWLVVVDLFETETGAVWKEPGVDPASSQVEVFVLPAATGPEKDGSLTNTMRLVQWHEKAVEPPGDARSHAAFVVELGSRLRELYRESAAQKDRPVRDLVWEYEPRGPRKEPAMETVLGEVNGYAAHDIEEDDRVVYAVGQLLDGYAALRADGSTACGNWIYSGVRPSEGTNLAARREQPREGDYLAHEWGFVWPANRRILANRASADLSGEPWSENKRLIWWDPAAMRWVGLDEPDFSLTMPPDAPRSWIGPLEGIGGADPFMMQTHGKGEIFARLADGPFPEHYEPFESPLRNALSSVRNNPLAKVFEVAGFDRLGTPDRYSYVLTTYTLAEHDAQGLSRRVPWLSELFSAPFAEVHPDAAREVGVRNGDVITVETPRGAVKIRALLTDRIPPLIIDGRKLYQIAIPWRWGWQGVIPSARGDVSNDLVASLGDPTTFIQESRALLCDIRKAVM